MAVAQDQNGLESKFKDDAGRPIRKNAFYQDKVLGICYISDITEDSLNLLPITGSTYAIRHNEESIRLVTSKLRPISNKEVKEEIIQLRYKAELLEQMLKPAGKERDCFMAETVDTERHKGIADSVYYKFFGNIFDQKKE